MEAWVYPLKILREFHLKFHTEGVFSPRKRWRDAHGATGIKHDSLRR